MEELLMVELLSGTFGQVSTNLLGPSFVNIGTASLAVWTRILVDFLASLHSTLGVTFTLTTALLTLEQFSNSYLFMVIIRNLIAYPK